MFVAFVSGRLRQEIEMSGMLTDGMTWKAYLSITINCF